MRALAVAAAVLCAAGCASQTGFGRATTLPRGELQGQAGLNLTLGAAQTAPGSRTPLPYLDLLAGLHHGLTDDVEVGGRLFGMGIRGLGFWGVAADTKVSLLRSDDEGSGGNIAAAAGASYHQIVVGGTPTHLFALTIPLLFGVDLGRDQLVFGPRVMGQVWTGQGQGSIETMSYGLSVAYSIAIGERWELSPELVWMGTPISFNGEVHGDDRYGAGFLHVGIGGAYRFGRRTDRSIRN